MARYIGAVCKICRREGEKLFLKADRCLSDKCSFNRRSYPPGQHGEGQARRKLSEYGLQLREKQKCRRIYGLLETQFRRYFEMAERKKGITGENLLQLLETRLDNVVYRLRLAGSRREARQLVRHGFFRVNDRKVNIPSYQVKPGDVITLKENANKSPLIKGILEANDGKNIPEWLELDTNNWTARVVSIPTREQIDVPVQEHLIVELYSR
ncbi:MAG TPA: 30S ribosomal protein S4 [Firmicutes bacterium]|uniref:Small ribosomal subunit protein uS4 n=1 Tax=Capillibacterium thermochitinicola TaxID=2699427 RepID=A0A8J6LLM4_9FIRM|nr:30S ribosomal protein S4 [Capillibacterium thermochitinicola]MBA2132544.1 30S ribosomal protein S4 [Capillibacterium thermochitinicola]HHW11545.1 30S ribosomal protein S4 [Bacillota bacterium]